MTIAVGDRLPDTGVVKLTPSGPALIGLNTLFAGRTVALFAVPGAFTPTCSARHLPGFVERREAILARGVDEIACTSVNDAFVMGAWAEAAGADGITMLADGNGDLARALGLEQDSTRFNMGVRSKRYALLARDGVVEQLYVEEPGAFEVSSADYLLARL